MTATSFSTKDTALGLRKQSVPPKKSPLVKQNSTANLAATILRKRIAEAEENTYLGSEADIALEVGVSLPTLRQTARMLEYEEVLLIKPGKGGGYFARRPSIESAIRSASQFLSATDLNNNEMFMDAADTIMTQIVTNAVNCENSEQIAKLAKFVESQRNQDKSAPLSPSFSFKVSTRSRWLFCAIFLLSSCWRRCLNFNAFLSASVNSSSTSPSSFGVGKSSC